MADYADDPRSNTTAASTAATSSIPPISLSPAPLPKDFRRPTPDMVAYLCKAAINGIPINSLGKLCGIPLPTWKAWLQEGAEQLASARYKPNTPLNDRNIKGWMVQELYRCGELGHAGLIQSIRETGIGGKAIRTKRTVIKQHGAIVSEIEESTFQQPSWQASAWLLERLAPEMRLNRAESTSFLAENESSSEEKPGFEVILQTGGPPADDPNRRILEAVRRRENSDDSTPEYSVDSGYSSDIITEENKSHDTTTPHGPAGDRASLQITREPYHRTNGGGSPLPGTGFNGNGYANGIPKRWNWDKDGNPEE